MRKHLAIALGMLFLSVVFALNANALTVEAAWAEYARLQKLYQDADDATDIADSKRDYTREEEGRLQTLLGYAKLEQDDNTEDIGENALAILGSLGVDPVDALSSIAASAIETVLDGVDAYKIWKKKSEIETALSHVSADAEKWVKEVEVLAKKEAEAKKKMDDAFAIWDALAISTVTYTLKPDSGSYTMFDDEYYHSATLTLSRGYSKVEWYWKSSTEEGLGTLKQTRTGSGESTTSSCYFYPSGSGDYVITAVAKIANTAEEVTASYTLTVLPSGVSFNATSFNTYDTLVVTVNRDNLQWAGMRLDTQLDHRGYPIFGSARRLTTNYGGALDYSSTIRSDGSIELSFQFPSKSSGFYGNIIVEVGYTDANGNSAYSEHSQYINVD